MATKYGWERLQRRGDWILIEGAAINQVARLAKLYVKEHFPEGSQVNSVSVPDGVMTFLTYVPEVRETVTGPDFIKSRPALTPEQLEDLRMQRVRERNRRIACEDHVSFVEECLRLEGLKK